jgi:hypothetical protein
MYWQRRDEEHWICLDRDLKQAHDIHQMSALQVARKILLFSLVVYGASLALLAFGEMPVAGAFFLSSMAAMVVMALSSLACIILQARELLLKRRMP